MAVLSIFKQALMISFFVFVMMLLIDFIDTASRKQLSDLIKGGWWRQYVLSSFLGATPGCLGAFMNVSLYIHGMISFGALAGGMIATSGDEAFVMLVQFPRAAIALFALLFVAGILCAGISDKLIKLMGVVPCESCLNAECELCTSNGEDAERIVDVFRLPNLFENFRSLSFTRFLLMALILSFLFVVALGIIGPSVWDWKRITFITLSLSSLYIAAVVSEHYLHDHIWDHIIKRHLIQIFLWSFGALLVVHMGLTFWNLEAFIHSHIVWILVIGALIGIVPESGPHLVFVMMYAQGLIPFSVLFTTSFVQDGHGMLPLLSYSIKDSLLIKAFNLVFGLTLGGVLLALGL
jgi:hypothetical protein